MLKLISEILIYSTFTTLAFGIFIVIALFLFNVISFALFFGISIGIVSALIVFGSALLVERIVTFFEKYGGILTYFNREKLHFKPITENNPEFQKSILERLNNKPVQEDDSSNVDSPNKTTTKNFLNNWEILVEGKSIKDDIIDDIKLSKK